MSRAFVKETDTVDELPDRIVSEHPNYVTPEGMTQIEVRIADLQARRAAAHNSADRDALAAISRDLRYWDSRRLTAMIVQSPHDAIMVRFGARVTIQREDGRNQTYRIVGEDEADPTTGTLSHASPLARVLLGKCVGDVVLAGQAKAEVVGIKTQTVSTVPE